MSKTNDVINMRVEYETRPVRKFSVQCPSCNNWFKGNEIADRWVTNEIDLSFAKFTCPVCDTEFSAYTSDPNPFHPNKKLHIIETDDTDSGCLTKQVTWT
jgi:C4-type Zn-finger protein